MTTPIVFAVFILVGWLVIAYLAFLFPGGLQGAWQQVRALPLVFQLLMWLLFLPWMITLWIFQTGWAIWIRLLLIFGLVWVTYFMAFPPLFQLFRGNQ